MYRLELEDIVGCGIYDRKTADQSLALLEENLHCFEHCLRSHLCHGDIWVTNLLVNHDGNVTGVLDFDRSCWGDIEWDLGIAEYCGVTGKSFWKGYGQEIETHTGDPAVRRMFYMLYEHQKYIIISMSSRRDSPSGARRYANESLRVMDNFRKTNIPGF